MHILKIPVKQLQHVNVTKRNIFGRNMLRAFDRPVAPCCDMLSVVALSLWYFTTFWPVLSTIFVFLDFR